MTHLARIVDHRSSQLVSAGYALETIAELLDFEASEGVLTPGQLNGLHHAVRSLGVLVKRTGFGLIECVEQEGVQ